MSTYEQRASALVEGRSAACVPKALTVFSLRRRAVASGLLALGCGAGFVAQAGDYNNRPLATGERSSGLGGAYVALSDDETGMLYNPAGIAYAPSGGGPSGTVNVLAGSSTEYENVFGSTTWTRDSIEVVPSFFGAMVDVGPGKLGGSLVVLDSSSEDQTDQFEDVLIGSTTYDELRVHNNYGSRTYNFGLSYAQKLAAPGWSAGGSLYVHYSKRDRSFLQRLSEDADPSTVEDDTSVLVQVEQEDTQIGLRPVLGLMYRTDAFSIGASISQVLPLTRDYFYAFTGDAVTPTDALSFDIIDDSSNTEDYPFNAALGMAFFASQETVYTVQLEYFSSREVDLDDVPGGAPPRDVGMKSVVNVAAGVEKRLSPIWLMRAGLYTDFANNRAGDAVLFERREEIDMYGGALSFSRKVGEGYWTLGLEAAYGSGDATLGDLGFGTGGDDIERVDASRFVYNLLLSTAW